jgi:opacity protein-like surface antigen
MRKYSFIFVFFFTIAGQIFSQNTVSKTACDVSFGLNIPVAEELFRDKYSPGYNVFFDVLFELDDEWGLRPGIKFDYFQRKSTPGITDAYFASFELKLDAVYSDYKSKKDFMPYGFGGAGIGKLKWAETVNSIRNDNVKTNFILNGGLGLKYRLSGGFSLMGEMGFNYNAIDITEKTFLNINIGLQIKL